jgi:hypothetical protein
MSERPITLREFSERIMRPAILSGIARGTYDNVIGEMLELHATGEMHWDDEILKAMLRRVPVILATPPVFEWARQGEVGAKLRVRLPS